MIGNLAEVVAVKGTLSDAQITQLDGYFKAKHGLREKRLALAPPTGPR